MPRRSPPRRRSRAARNRRRPAAARRAAAFPLRAAADAIAATTKPPPTSIVVLPEGPSVTPTSSQSSTDNQINRVDEPPPAVVAGAFHAVGWVHPAAVAAGGSTSAGPLQPAAVVSGRALGDLGRDAPSAVLAAPLPSGDAPGVTTRVSGTPSSAGNNDSGGPPPPTVRAGTVMSHGGEAISGDGNWLAFVSSADNLVASDTNSTADVFLKDLQDGSIQRVPYIDGRQLPSRCAAAEPSISADGRILAFTVYLVADPTRAIGVFAYDRQSGLTTAVSLDDGAIVPASQPSVSPDGGFIAYARPFSFGEVSFLDVVVYNRQRNVSTALMQTLQRGPVGNNRAPAISRNGRWLALKMDGALDPNDNNLRTDIYLVDGESGAITLVTKGPGGGSSGDSSEPSISDDGNVIAFASRANNLTSDNVPGGTNQIYVWERSTGALRLVSVGQSDPHATDASFSASISANGDYVAFQSAPLGTVGGDSPVPGTLPTAGPGDVFLRDLRLDVTTRISLNSKGAVVQGDSGHPSVSGDGMSVAFDSTSPDLVANDTNGARDVFLRRLVPEAVVSPELLDFGQVPLGDTGGPLSVTVTSVGWPRLAIASVKKAGANPGDFPVTDDGCSDATLRRGASCEIGVGFRPTEVGRRTATLVIADNTDASPHRVRLIGEGSKIVFKIDPVIGPRGS